MAQVLPAPTLQEEEVDAHEEHPVIMNPLHIVTYTQWFANAANDPFRLNYAMVMNRFDPGNNMAGDTLLEQVLGSPNVPQTFLAAINSQAGYCIFLLHWPARYVM